MAGKAKGSTKAKGSKSTKKTPVPDRLPPATQAEILAVDPDKAVTRIPVLEVTSNVPYVTADQLLEKAKGPEAKALAKQNAEQEKAAKDTALAAQKAESDRKAATEAEYKDRQSRAVTVQALRKGFYPADGRIRNPGEIFEYVPVKTLNRKTKKYEVESQLPSWLQHVDGTMPTRVVDEVSPSFAAEQERLGTSRPASAGSSSVI